MRKCFSIFAVIALCVLTASCGVLGMGGSNSGSANGQQSGAALKSLYSQYKSDGKVDLANLNNVISMAQLVNGIQGLKNVDDKSKFYGDFAAGLILGSAIAAAGLTAAAQSQQAQQVQQTATTASNNVANTVQAISETTAGVTNTLSSLATIFSMFGGN